MAIIVFIIFVWLFCKGLKALFRAVFRHKPHKARIAAKPEKKNDYMAALLALQQARETQEILIRYIDESITTAATAQETISLMNKKATAIEKLARIEKQITKLIS